MQSRIRDKVCARIAITRCAATATRLCIDACRKFAAAVIVAGVKRNLGATMIALQIRSHPLWLLTLAASALLVACAEPAARSADALTRLVAELTQQADRWDKAIVRKDRAEIEANMADVFRNIDGGGSVYDKAAFIDDLMSPKLEIDPYTVEDFDVRLYGDVALLCGRTRMISRLDGKMFTTHYRYIDIPARRNGRWQVISVQISKIPNK